MAGVNSTDAGVVDAGTITQTDTSVSDQAVLKAGDCLDADGAHVACKADEMVYEIVKLPEDCYEPVLDEDGKPVLDEKGEPKVKPLCITKGIYVTSLNLEAISVGEGEDAYSIYWHDFNGDDKGQTSEFVMGPDFGGKPVETCDSSMNPAEPMDPVYFKTGKELGCVVNKLAGKDIVLGEKDLYLNAGIEQPGHVCYNPKSLFRTKMIKENFDVVETCFHEDDPRVEVFEDYITGKAPAEETPWWLTAILVVGGSVVGGFGFFAGGDLYNFLKGGRSHLWSKFFNGNGNGNTPKVSEGPEGGDGTKKTDGKNGGDGTKKSDGKKSRDGKKDTPAAGEKPGVEPVKSSEPHRFSVPKELLRYPDLAYTPAPGFLPKNGYSDEFQPFPIMYPPLQKLFSPKASPDFLKAFKWSPKSLPKTLKWSPSSSSWNPSINVRPPTEAEVAAVRNVTIGASILAGLVAFVEFVGALGSTASAACGLFMLVDENGNPIGMMGAPADSA